MSPGHVTLEMAFQLRVTRLMISWWRIVYLCCCLACPLLYVFGICVLVSELCIDIIPLPVLLIYNKYITGHNVLHFLYEECNWHFSIYCKWQLASLAYWHSVCTYQSYWSCLLLLCLPKQLSIINSSSLSIKHNWCKFRATTITCTVVLLCAIKACYVLFN